MSLMLWYRTCCRSIFSTKPFIFLRHHCSGRLSIFFGIIQSFYFGIQNLASNNIPRYKSEFSLKFSFEFQALKQYISKRKKIIFWIRPIFFFVARFNSSLWRKKILATYVANHNSTRWGLIRFDSVLSFEDTILCGL